MLELRSEPVVTLISPTEPSEPSERSIQIPLDIHAVQQAMADILAGSSEVSHRIICPEPVFTDPQQKITKETRDLITLLFLGARSHGHSLRVEIPNNVWKCLEANDDLFAVIGDICSIADADNRNKEPDSLLQIGAITGPMGGGKTDYLIRRFNQEKAKQQNNQPGAVDQILLVKPSSEKRFGDGVVSRTGQKVDDPVRLQSPLELTEIISQNLNASYFIGVEEAMFWSGSDWLTVLKEIKNSGVHVSLLVTGLNSDFVMRPFSVGGKHSFGSVLALAQSGIQFTKAELPYSKNPIIRGQNCAPYSAKKAFQDSVRKESDVVSQGADAYYSCDISNHNFAPVLRVLSQILVSDPQQAISGFQAIVNYAKSHNLLPIYRGPSKADTGEEPTKISYLAAPLPVETPLGA